VCTEWRRYHIERHGRLALSKRRQIFFATANEKLAAMVERKFDFLGKGKFCKIDLYRASIEAATIGS
jgi:hypothetical protein